MSVDVNETDGFVSKFNPKVHMTFFPAHHWIHQPLTTFESMIAFKNPSIS